MDAAHAILGTAEQRSVPDMRYEIKFVRGHVEVYDREGNFVFSADTEREAEEDLRLLSA